MDVAAPSSATAGPVAPIGEGPVKWRAFKLVRDGGRRNYLRAQSRLIAITIEAQLSLPDTTDHETLQRCSRDAGQASSATHASAPASAGNYVTLLSMLLGA